MSSTQAQRSDRPGGRARGRRLGRPAFLLCALAAILVIGCIMPVVASAAISYGSGNTATTTNTTLRLTKPSGTSQGDLLLVQITRNGGGSVTTPAGWTKLVETNQGTNMGQTILYKVAGASEGASYAFTINYGGPGRRAVGAILRYTGVDRASPIAASSANSAATGTTLTANSVNAPANSRIVACYGTDNYTGAGYPTTPAGMTSLANVGISTTRGPWLRAADQAIASAGATGVRTSTAGASTPWVAHLVALQPATLTVTATADNKTYDGTTAATAHLATTGIYPGDTVTLSYASATFATKNVGNGKTVNVTGISIGGADAGKYILMNTTASATASITAAELTVDGAVADDKTYDGTTDATVDFSGASLVGVVDSEDVVLDSSAYSASFATKDVGDDIAVSVDGVAITGGDAGNYTLAQPSGLTASITAAELTVDGAVADDKTYDGTTDATAQLASTDIVPGDTVTLSYASATFATKDVGTGKTVNVTGISIGGADAGNYNLTNTTASATANITAKALTITANDKTKAYGKTVTFAGTEFTTSGLVDGDVVNSVTIQSAGAAAKAIGGAYPIVASAATGTGLGNYDISYVNGTMTVVGGYRIPSFYKPLRIADPRRFHRGATIRVAFRVRDPNGKLIVNAHPTLRVTRSGRVVVGPKAVKYNPTKRLYIYNLRTPRAWRLSTYTLRVSLGVGSTGRSVSFRVIR